MNTPKDIHIAGLTNDLMTVRDNLNAQIAEKDAKIAEQAGQIVALREALIGCSKRLQVNTANFLGEPIPATCQDAPSALDNIKAVAAALSTHALPVVVLEDVRPLLDALKIIAANPGASHGPNFLYDSGPIATGAIAKFNAKHPQP